MTRVLFPTKSAVEPDLKLFGGKARALARLHGTDACIPEWFVLSPRAHEDSRKSTAQSPTDVYPCAAVIAEVEAAIAKTGLAQSKLAVRSSAIDEDGATRAYAGMYESQLNVAPRDVAEAIAAVWRSGFSQHIDAYRGDQPSSAPAAPAVIVQRLIDADYSGVAFSSDPVDTRSDRCVIAAVRGLGDRLVAGEVDGDTFRVDEMGQIIEREVGSDPVPVSDSDICRIAALARFAADHFGTPQDIEWAMADGELYLLQSRSITTLQQPDQKRGDETVLWDNSNIIESYCGVTTPLTFSFASIAYENVYLRFSQLMGVSRRRRAAEQQLFRNMLGLIQGRVYYNLLNWYRLIALFPGFSLNRGYLERMMGVGEALSAEFGARIAPAQSRPLIARVMELLGVSRTFARMIWNRVRLRATIGRFNQRLDTALAPSEPPLSELSYAALALRYRDLERRLLGEWDAPIINDFFCMIAFGVLSGLLRKWFGEDGAQLTGNLIRCDANLISEEPVRRIQAMARRAAKTPSIMRELTVGSVSDAEAAISGDPLLKQEYKDYLERFSDRCLAELKLESPTLREDPLPLLHSIGQSALSASDKPRLVYNQARADAESALMLRLRDRPIARIILRMAIAEARARTRDRENLRFERTRVFGEARRLFVEMGKRLHDHGILADPRDVFYLELGELLGFAEGTATSARLGPIALARKEEFEAYARSPDLPPRFVTSGAVHFGNLQRIARDEEVGEPNSANERRGLGCSPGTIRSQVRVVRDPRNVDMPAGTILVAEHTDPGWVTLFVRSSGVIVERGSPLSHSAIVAREMGIPAVVSLKGATRWLKDGDIVEMDGRTGIVTRIVCSDEEDGHDTAEAA